MSKSQSQIQHERTALAKGFREGGLLWCECCEVRGREPHQWTDMHERVLRSRMGDATDEYNIILLCRACHEHVHKNPAWATELGFMAHSWETYVADLAAQRWQRPLPASVAIAYGVGTK